jgi:chorismate mutase
MTNNSCPRFILSRDHMNDNETVQSIQMMPSTQAERNIACRGVRGAITVEETGREPVLQATRELLAVMIRVNGIEKEDVASAIFTTTTDITSAFPATAARQLGWLDVPLMCGHEMHVEGALPRCIRILLHWNTTRLQHEIQHVYLREARTLRPDKSLVLSAQDIEDLNRWIDEHLIGI